MHHTRADPTAAAGAHGASTFVSATQPPQPPKILKNMAQKTDAPLKNAAAWANLGEEDEADEAPGEDGPANGEAAAPEEDKEDELWAAFQSRDEQERKRVSLSVVVWWFGPCWGVWIRQDKGP